MCESTQTYFCEIIITLCIRHRMNIYGRTHTQTQYAPNRIFSVNKNRFLFFSFFVVFTNRFVFIVISWFPCKSHRHRRCRCYRFVVAAASVDPFESFHMCDSRYYVMYVQETRECSHQNSYRRRQSPFDLKNFRVRLKSESFFLLNILCTLWKQNKEKKQTALNCTQLIKNIGRREGNGKSNRWQRKMYAIFKDTLLLLLLPSMEI